MKDIYINAECSVRYCHKPAERQIKFHGNQTRLYCKYHADKAWKSVASGRVVRSLWDFK